MPRTSVPSAPRCTKCASSTYRFRLSSLGLVCRPCRCQLADATSYAERLYDYRSVGLLNAAGASAALTRPTLPYGVVWEPGALQSALAIAGSYPYFLQESA